MSALRKLPVAHMFEDLDDETLVEVMLLESFIDDRNTKALVLFIPHGDTCNVDRDDIPPALVPGRWFSELMPMSIFLDIPEDASAISPVWDVNDGYAADASALVGVAGLGVDLASRWRANKRPVVTTKQFVATCHSLVPAHLLGIAFDAREALESGSFTKAARGRIATFCELMSRHLESLDQPASETE